MNYGRKTPSTYRSNPSVYSHVTGRSSNMRSSMKSLKIPWYQRPIIKNNQYLNIQKGAIVMSLASIFVSIFTVVTGIFDLYCYAMAAPGSTHYGYYIISYEFVYVGNVHVRNTLVVCALFSMLGGVVNFVTGVMLLIALRKCCPCPFILSTRYSFLILFCSGFVRPEETEYENKILPWLWSYGIFIAWRFLAFLFFAIVNDLIFAYNILMTILWIMIIAGSIYGWLMVYSLYVELSDLTKLEDLAHLRMGTLQSLNASTVHSLAGSRPTTPHSTVSTMPVS